MSNNSVLQRSFSQHHSEISSQLHEDLKEMFRIIDTSKTGKVPISDLKQVMESIGNQGRQSMVYHLLIFHENQGKSYIDFSDFLQIMTQRLDTVHSEEDYEKVFSRYDPSLEYIDAERIKKVAIELNETPDAFRIQEMIKLADSDGDGKVSFDDYYKMMSTPFVKKKGEELKASSVGNKALLNSEVKRKSNAYFEKI